MSTDYTEFESKMKKTASVLTEQYDSVRAGKANPAVLDRVTVDYYGSPTPIQQIGVGQHAGRPHARSSSRGTAPCSRALRRPSSTSDLGINPQNDGRVIRLVFPAADRGAPPRSRQAGQEVQRGRQGRRAQHPPRRDGQIQGAEEEVRDHRGRLQESSRRICRS